MEFDFSTSSRILFGSGVIQEVGKVASAFGKKGLIIHSKGMNVDHLCNLLKQAQFKMTTLPVSGEPTTESIQPGIDLVRGQGYEFIIAAGGGSTMDAAKAISAMATNPGDILDYLEVVGKNLPIKMDALPMIAVPTTAGTGSEVTRNAVLKVSESKVKVSLRSSMIIPRVALIDPELTLELSPPVTASTGMDALTQCIEPFLAKKANRMTDIFCQEGIRRAARSILSAFQNGTNLRSRENMAWSSLLGGISLANAGLGAVHGFAGVIGGMYPAAHGVICARLLPEVVSMNYRVISTEGRDPDRVQKFHVIASLLIGDEQGEIVNAIQWLRSTCETLNIPRLKALGIRTTDLDEIVKKAMVSSSMKGNPVELSEGQLMEILQNSL